MNVKSWRHMIMQLKTSYISSLVHARASALHPGLWSDGREHNGLRDGGLFFTNVLENFPYSPAIP